jgi:hypothetical protein
MLYEKSHLYVHTLDIKELDLFCSYQCIGTFYIRSYMNFFCYYFKYIPH